MKTLAVLLSLSATAIAGELHPIVEMKTGYFFGGSADGKWVKAEEAVKSMKAKTPLRIFGLSEEVGKTSADKPISVDEPCPDTLMVSLSSKPKAGVVAVDAPWNPLPRKPRTTDPTQQVYVEAVRDFLKGRGISDPKVRITRILRVDLDGDGEDEVLLSATNYFSKPGEAPMHAPARGSYSVVLLRRLVAGKVETEFVAGEVYLKDESNAPSVYEIPAVLDLNGDGKLEVIVRSQYYEGAETTVYDCSGGKCNAVLAVECGA